MKAADPAAAIGAMVRGPELEDRHPVAGEEIA
jgi:hypothetical protein